jgi:hypothetical protein
LCLDADGSGVHHLVGSPERQDAGSGDEEFVQPGS